MTANVHHSSESVEWYTPPDLFELASAAYGPFDLDPAADPRSPIWPLVERHWTVADDGLAQPWEGAVWVNPPYGRTIGDWTRKAAAEVAAGRASVVVMLVPARTDTRWWVEAIEAGAEAEYLEGRVRFVLPDGKRLAGAPFPSALLVFRRHRGADVAPGEAAVWLTTEEAAKRCRIREEQLRDLIRIPSKRPAWSQYAGVPGTRSARYRWRADLVDDWFEEVCAWRASRSEGTPGPSGGGTEGEGAGCTSSRSAPSARPKRSPPRSTGRSSSSGGTSLADEWARRR